MYEVNGVKYDENNQKNKHGTKLEYARTATNGNDTKQTYARKHCRRSVYETG